MKRDRIAFCTFGFTAFLTNSSPYSIHPQRLSTTRRRESDPAEDTKSGGLFANRDATSVLVVMISIRVKWASPSQVHLYNFTDHFTPREAQASQNHSVELSRRWAVQAAQNVPEAGATPPLDAPCATAHLGSFPRQSTAIEACAWQRQIALSNGLYAASHTASTKRPHTERR